MEEIGWRGGEGVTLLSMTPNKTTEIGTGEEEVRRKRRGRRSWRLERMVNVSVSGDACVLG